MESAGLDRFFATVNTELITHNRFKALVAPQFAPDFNIFSCLYPDENRLSAVIAMLLDPNGEHGQGETFLNLFLDSIEASGYSSEALNLLRQELQIGRTKKILEATTHMIESSLRRIDILLEIGNMGFAIENKPWAMDQENQIEDYIEHLKNRYSDRYLLIYLSGNGCNPGEKSLASKNRETLQQSGRFLVFSYFSMKDWVSRCAEKCRASRVRNFLEDFQSYLAVQFSGGVTVMEKKLVIEQATKKENIGAAFAISSSWPCIASKKIEELAELVSKKNEIKSCQLENGVDFEYDEKDTGFYFYKKKWTRYRIKFCFETISTRDFLCGIVKNEASPPDKFDIKLAEKLDKNYRHKSYPNTWWTWWQYFDYPYRNWNSSEEPWIGICENGITVNLVASMLERIIDCVAKDIDEIEGQI